MPRPRRPRERDNGSQDVTALARRTASGILAGQPIGQFLLESMATTLAGRILPRVGDLADLAVANAGRQGKLMDLEAQKKQLEIEHLRLSLLQAQARGVGAGAPRAPEQYRAPRPDPPPSASVFDSRPDAENGAI